MRRSNTLDLLLKTSNIDTNEAQENVIVNKSENTVQPLLISSW